MMSSQDRTETEESVRITARVLLLEWLKPFHDEGFCAGFTVTPTTLGLSPFSAQAAAYSCGARRENFNLDAVLSHCKANRHLRTEATPPGHWAIFLGQREGGTWPSPRNGVHRDEREWVAA